MKYLYAITQNKTEDGLPEFTRLFREFGEALAHRNFLQRNFDNNKNGNIVKVYFGDEKNYFADVTDGNYMFSTSFIDSSRLLKIDLKQIDKINRFIDYIRDTDEEILDYIEPKLDEIVKIIKEKEKD